MQVIGTPGQNSLNDLIDTMHTQIACGNMLDLEFGHSGSVNITTVLFHLLS